MEPPRDSRVVVGRHPAPLRERLLGGAAMPPEADVLSGLKILVVEDSLLLAELICSIIDDAGGQCIGPAGTLEKATHLARNELDGAFLDINLNGVASFPVARLLQSNGVPVAFLTGYSALILPEDLRHLPLIAKPFEKAHVLAEAVRFAALRTHPRPR